jgi:hypothetical protein
MSHAATNWAIQQRGLKPTTKIVLWHLCDRFNPDYGCFPTQDRLAHDCEISRATLNRHLDALERSGLIRRLPSIDPRTGRQRPTRYLLGFEPGFTPRGPDDPDPDPHPPFDPEAPDLPCPDLRHGADAENPRNDKGLAGNPSAGPCLDLRHGSVSHSGANPCLKNGDIRVSNRDTNPVREPLSKPVKEEEDAQAREAISDEIFGELLDALGLHPGALPGWWQGWPPRLHVQRWRDELGLTEAEIVATAEASREEHPEPPDGPKALDRAMQRAAQRKLDEAGRKRSKPRGETAAPAVAATPITDLIAFYADVVNSERFLPGSAITNTMRDAMLARGLVTAERLAERGVR